MAKFKVGDRVRAVGDTAILVKGREYTVVAPSAIGPAHHVFVNTGSNGVLNYTDDFFELVEPVAVAPATATLEHKFKVGDRVRFTNKVLDYWWFKAGQTGTVVPRELGYYTYDVKVDGAYFDFPAHVNAEHIELLPAEEPATPATTIAITLGVDLNLPLPPQVGDDVLIPGVISAINHSPRGTNYNIVFETQNRRMSLHFLDEDFIVDPEQGDGDCPCANDNGPVPTGDTAKAFDALVNSIFGLAARRAA